MRGVRRRQRDRGERGGDVATDGRDLLRVHSAIAGHEAISGRLPPSADHRDGCGDLGTWREKLRDPGDGGTGAEVEGLERHATIRPQTERRAGLANTDGDVELRHLVTRFGLGLAGDRAGHDHEGLRFRICQDTPAFWSESELNKPATAVRNGRVTLAQYQKFFHGYHTCHQGFFAEPSEAAGSFVCANSARTAVTQLSMRRISLVIIGPSYSPLWA